MGVAKRKEERRLMMFQDARSMWTEGRLTQEQAAELLGVSARTFRRWTDRYGEDGIEGLRDRRVSRASHRAAPLDEVMRMVDRYRTRHEGWSVRHFYAWYWRDGGARSYNWVRKQLQASGAVPRGKVDKSQLTQFGRAMILDLGIDMIPAYSPEARGRSERAFRTHQDRLVKELALAGITEMDAANRYLREVYRPAFNAEFARPAKEDYSAFVALDPATDLDSILCELHERVVGRDNCVRFDGLTLQLPSDRRRPHYFKARVKVRRHMDGGLSVWHGPRLLQRYGPDGRPAKESLSDAA